MTDKVRKTIRVSPKRIEANAKALADGRPELCEPAIIVEIHNPPPVGSKFIYAYRVEVPGPCVVVHDDRNPLPSGTRVWIETTGELQCFGDPPAAS